MAPDSQPYFVRKTYHHFLHSRMTLDSEIRIRDKAEAMRVYARQAKDFELGNWASEIRIRAERRLGEMLKAQKKSGGMRDGGTAMKARSQPNTEFPTKLSELGISKSLSSRAQAIAEVPEAEFEP